MKKTKGKLIVLEGIDGSGKSTQHELLVKFLRKNKKIVKTIKFPRHGKAFFGLMVDRYLDNEFGPAGTLDPHLASMIFALDRWEVKNSIEKWIYEGHYVVPDRYATSNFGHQMGKIIDNSEEDKEKFIRWLEELEYKVLKNPKPDLVIYLDVKFEIILKLLRKRGRADGHESDINYLSNSQKAYQYLAARSSKWITVNCTNQDNTDILSIPEIHEKIIRVINNYL